VIHGLRGKPSKRRLSEATRKKIIAIRQQPQEVGFGPTLASEHLESGVTAFASGGKHCQLMSEGGLWRAKKRAAERVHIWRERRARFGELVQWDTAITTGCCRLINHGQQYVDGAEYYETRYCEQQIQAVLRKARKLGLQLVTPPSE